MKRRQSTASTTAPTTIHVKVWEFESDLPNTSSLFDASAMEAELKNATTVTASTPMNRERPFMTHQASGCAVRMRYRRRMKKKTTARTIKTMITVHRIPMAVALPASRRPKP
jgi:hypothetical protein